MSPARINRISLALLATGFAAALVIGVAAAPREPDAWRDDPLNQKRNRRQLVMIGGQANQLSADFIEWFGGLWEGTNLAYTVAALTVVAVGGFRFVAARTQPPTES